MKKILRLTGIIVFAALYILPLRASADEVERTLAQKKFDVKKGAKLSVEHKFGRLTCKNWDENAISVKITASVEARDSETANKLMDHIRTSIDGNSNEVSVETDFNEKMFKGDKNDISIDVEIWMPVSVKLDIEHRFGNAYIDEADGSSEISSQYGSIEIKGLKADENKVEIGFGEGHIDYIGGGDVEVSYSTFTIGESPALTIESNYSTVSVDKARKLKIENEGGNVDIGDVAIIELKSKFSDFKIKNLTELMNADTEYGSLKVRNIAPGFSDITVDNGFGSVILGFDSSASFAIEADLNFCDLDYPSGKARFSKKTSDTTEKYYQGTIGEGNSSSKVTIDSSFGNVVIDM